jgi:UbiD family decarboxylase
MPNPKPKSKILPTKSAPALPEPLAMFEEEIELVQQSVKSDLDLARISRKDTTRPFLFTNVDGKGQASGWKVVTGLWAKRERIAKAIGMDRAKLTSALLDAMRHPRPPAKAKKARFMENSIRDVDLMQLPIPKFFKRDGGRYFTAAMVVAEMEGVRNVSYNRLMVIGKDRMSIRIVPRHLFSMFKKTKGDLKVAIILTLNPAVMLSWAMSVAYGLDELTIASALLKTGRGKGLAIARLPNGISVPTDCQIVMEARITKEEADEGPFVDITGTYDPVRKQQVVKVDRLWHVDGPVLYAISPGAHDHYLMMGMPREPIILDSVQKVIPRVGGVRLTEGGCCWLHGVVSIEQQKDGDAKNAMMAAFGAHPSMKRVIVVDPDIDIYDDRQVEWALATRFQGDKDMLVIHGARGSTLDPSSEGDKTTKVGMDATKPVGNNEDFSRVIE